LERDDITAACRPRQPLHYQGINRQFPQSAFATDEAIKIKASKKIAFRPAKELKEAV
jgi:hypothetical protein